jgi:glycosyltransferase involved in cell wall biosynthesis
MTNKKYIIGTNSLDYNPKRNFAGLNFKAFTIKKTMDLCRIIDHIYFKLKKKSHPFFSNTFFDIGLNRVSMFHFFNSVSLSNKPWVVTFENEIPRPYLRSKYLVKRLTHKSCKKIIAFCERAKNIETYLLDQYPELKKTIMDKMIVLQPSQPLHIQSITEKDYFQPVTFTFVGVDFFRKGGAEILKATEKLIEEGFDFKLNVVSQLKKGEWKDEHISDTDIEKTKEIIQRNNTVITHSYSLASSEIMNLFKRSHVGLLPSYGETYGYVVLEAQACGCAVITPNMPPFHEFNDNSIGWLIDVPLKERNGTLDSDLSGENRILFQTALYNGLYISMKEAIENKELLKAKAAKAIDHIKKDHSPEKNAEILERIYFEALNK